MLDITPHLGEARLAAFDSCSEKSREEIERSEIMGSGIAKISKRMTRCSIVIREKILRWFETTGERKSWRCNEDTFKCFDSRAIEVGTTW